MVRKREALGDRVMRIIIYVLLVLMSLLFIYPFWQTVVLSFSPPTYANTMGIKLWPPKLTLESYQYVLQNREIFVGYMNSLFRTVVGTVFSVFTTYCASYALSRKELPFRSGLTLFIIFTMFFSGGLVPSYININNMGLMNTRWALILPTLTSAWNIIITRNFISSLPAELEEAAMVDGARPLQIVFRIVFRLSAPILAVLTLWSAVGHWNAWFDAMIYTNKSEMVVLQLLLRRMIVTTQNENTIIEQAGFLEMTPASLRAATIIVAILPIICLYPFLQKHFIKGMLVGSIKG